MNDKNRDETRQGVPSHRQQLMHPIDNYLEGTFSPLSAGPREPMAGPHEIDGSSAPGIPGPDVVKLEAIPNLDSNASGATLPGQGGNFLPPPDINEANLGLQRPAMPDMEFKGGEGLSPADFVRDALTAGHARRSPGDGSSDTAHRAFFEKDAEVGEADLGPGILPTPDTGESYGPIRASDFARGFSENVPGQQDPSPGSPATRGPISPEQALGLGKERMRGDNLQADQQPSPMRGNDFPDTAGRGSGDDASHQVVKPEIAVAPSTADSTGIAKSEFAKKVE